MSEIIQEIIKKINKAQTVAIYCHTNPDGDTISSALALSYAIQKKGKETGIFCDSEIPKHFYCLLGADKIKLPEKKNYDLAIAIDCSDMERLGSALKSFLNAKTQIAIDHHKSHQKFSDLTLVDDKAAATAEIMVDVIKSMKALDDVTAKLLFAGMVTDSGCFSYSNTTKKTMSAASELLSYNFDNAKLVYEIFKSIEFNKFVLKNRILSKTRFYLDNKVAFIVFTSKDFEETNTSSNDTEGIISEVIDVLGVEVAFSIAEVGNKNFKVSIRTKDIVDASDCAMCFGGGGHKNAAGCRINGYLEDIIEKLLKIASDRL